jgi:hypothetical protein
LYQAQQCKSTVKSAGSHAGAWTCSLIALRYQPLLVESLGALDGDQGHQPSVLSPFMANLADLAEPGDTGRKSAGKWPPLPWKCREHRSKRPSWVVSYHRMRHNLTKRAELPHTASPPHHTGCREASSRPHDRIRRFEGGGSAEARGTASGWRSGFAQSSGRSSSSDQERSDPCSGHQHGCCGRFSCVFAPQQRPESPAGAPGGGLDLTIPVVVFMQ